MTKRRFGLFKRKYLPPLGKEHDKYYIVKAKGINSSLLRRSGFIVFHRGCYAMMIPENRDSTYSLWQLNPYKQRGIDAALPTDDAITFDEFLALYDGKIIEK